MGSRLSSLVPVQSVGSSLSLISASQICLSWLSAMDFIPQRLYDMHTSINIIYIYILYTMNFPGAHTAKNLLAMQETWVQSLGWEDPLEKGMATHSSILAWRIPWTEEPGGLQSMGSQRVGHD